MTTLESNVAIGPMCYGNHYVGLQVYGRVKAVLQSSVGAWGLYPIQAGGRG